MACKRKRKRRSRRPTSVLRGSRKRKPSSRCNRNRNRRVRCRTGPAPCTSSGTNRSTTRVLTANERTKPECSSICRSCRRSTSPPIFRTVRGLTSLPLEVHLQLRVWLLMQMQIQIQIHRVPVRLRDLVQVLLVHRIGVGSHFRGKKLFAKARVASD